MATKYKGKSDLGVAHLWREDLPKEIEAILKEFEDVFLKNLLPGLTPIHEGHQFKIDLKNETPPIHRPIYKLSSLDLAEARKLIEYMLEHGFIRLSNATYEPSFVRTKEGWWSPLLHQLPMVQQENGQEQIPIASPNGTIRMARRRHSVQQN